MSTTSAPDEFWAPMRVLLADDDALLRSLLRRHLEQDGIKAEEAADGVDVLTRLERPPLPDAVVLDVGMPGEDGLTILRHIRGNVVTAGLPVVMLTGRRTSLDVASALALGVSGYVAKPFNPARLLALLRRLGHSTPERPGGEPR